MFEIGRVCIKIAGRDAGNYCIVVDKIDDNNVLIDGNVRRKKCNVKHLEPTEKIIKIKKNESGENIKKVMYSEGIKIKEKKIKRKKTTEKSEKPKKRASKNGK